MNALVVQIAIIFIPGFLWASIDQRFGPRVNRTQTHFLIMTLIFGLISYSVAYIAYASFGLQFSTIAIDSENSIFLTEFVDEILVSIPVAVTLATVWLYINNKKVVAKFLQKIKATRRYGDEDVWDFTLNSDVPHVEYVHFRDFENGYVYAGWVGAFSESEKLRELLLRDVVIYDIESGKEILQSPHMYLSRNKENITLEFPHKNPATGENDEQNAEGST